MFCTRCGCQQPDEHVFCTNCGTLLIAAAASSEPLLIRHSCPNCGGTMDVRADMTILACPFCGAKNTAHGSGVVKFEQHRTQANKNTDFEAQKRLLEIEREKHKAWLEAERIKHEAELKKTRQPRQSAFGLFLRFLFKVIVCLVIAFFVLIILGMSYSLIRS